jgi:hypothetical protein
VFLVYSDGRKEKREKRGEKREKRQESRVMSYEL